jgi:hypothetical protein
MIKFKNREQIQRLIEQTEDYEETKRLIYKFKKLQEIRKQTMKSHPKMFLILI